MKKIADFNKEELIAHMKASGEYYRYDIESKAWKRAFDLYRQEQGARLEMDCQKCVSKVSEWLQL